MKILRWTGLSLAAVIVVLVLLDTFGGMLFDGPLGPIPGGAFSGPVSPNPPDWSQIGEVIELEIRPENPWSLTVWGVEIDGELYVPHASGPLRRWVPVALADPRVRVRTGGQIYEGRIEKLEPGPLRTRALTAVAQKYGFDTDGEDDGSVWIFHIAPRS